MNKDKEFPVDREAIAREIKKGLRSILPREGDANADAAQGYDDAVGYNEDEVCSDETSEKQIPDTGERT